MNKGCTEWSRGLEMKGWGDYWIPEKLDLWKGLFYPRCGLEQRNTFSWCQTCRERAEGNNICSHSTFGFPGSGVTNLLLMAYSNINLSYSSGCKNFHIALIGLKSWFCRAVFLCSIFKSLSDFLTPSLHHLLSHSFWLWPTCFCLINNF